MSCFLDTGFTKSVVLRQSPSKSRASESKMSFVKKTRHVGNMATILELEGRLTAVEGSELKGWVNGLLAGGHSAILLDCARMGFIDSQGVGALVRTWVSAERRSKLKLFSLTPHVKEVLAISGLLKVMDSFEDVGSALHSLSQDS